MSYNRCLGPNILHIDKHQFEDKSDETEKKTDKLSKSIWLFIVPRLC